MKSFFNRASLLHGLIAGILLFAAKFIFYMTGHWQLRFEYGYTLGSFIIIIAAMVMGSRGDKKNIEQYTYWQAMLSCIITVGVCAFISVFADQVLYLIDKNLSAQTKTIIVQRTFEGMEKMKLSEEINEKVLKKVEEMPLSDIAGIVPFLISFLQVILVNGVWGFAVAAITFMRKPKLSYEDKDADPTDNL